MAEFRRAGHEQINTFEVDESYLFKHYFDQEDIFDRLKKYYNNHQYRFEIPPKEFDSVRAFLSDYGYGIVVVDVSEEFVVVVKQYTDHPENIFKESIIQRTVDGFNYFLMTDQVATEEAIRDGATRLTETNLENPF